MKLGKAIALAGAGYLIGSLSFGRLIGKFALPEEEMEGTQFELPGGEAIDYHGVSATSVAIKASPKWGIATGVLDTAKAAVPTLVAKRAWPDEPYHVAVATGVMLGHNYPVFHRFSGGRGQTPFYGSVMVIDPLAVPITNVAAIGLGAGILRNVFFAYTLGMTLTMPYFAIRRNWDGFAFAVIGNVLFTAASYRELLQYLELWREGKIERLSSWQDFKESYPAMQKSEGTVWDKPSEDDAEASS